MISPARRTTEWLYEGVWGVLSGLFRVPREAPELPAGAGEQVAAFRPAVGFLRYLSLQLWMWLVPLSLLILALWLVAAFAWPAAGIVLLAPALALSLVPGVLAYVAMHLRYDTTWYVLSDRSLRIRRGIWTIHETTITYENIQNVTVNQGPLQRLFGIADVVVDTAGGGGMVAGPHGTPVGGGGHHGLIEGVDDAERIRNLILGRLKRSAGAGLGDDHDHLVPAIGWRPEHLAALREIRAAAQALARA
ncbi:MAG: PH domain-containing protein [Pirellulales bacterium]